MNKGEDGVWKVAEKVWWDAIGARGFTSDGMGQLAKLFLCGRGRVGVYGRGWDIIKQLLVEGARCLEYALDCMPGGRKDGWWWGHKICRFDAPKEQLGTLPCLPQ